MSFSEEAWHIFEENILRFLAVGNRVNLEESREKKQNGKNMRGICLSLLYDKEF